MVKKLAGITISLLAAVAIAQTSGQDLVQGFKNPPESAKPRTWWHWTNGNVTLDGITKDLEWMKRSGIGGFQLVDVASGGGQAVEKRSTSELRTGWMQSIIPRSKDSGWGWRCLSSARLGGARRVVRG